MGLYWDDGKENGDYYSILGVYWDNGKENGDYYSMLGLYWGYIGMMEKKRETPIVCWGYIGVTRVKHPMRFLMQLEFHGSKISCAVFLTAFWKTWRKVTSALLGTLYTCDCLHFLFSSPFPYIPDVDPIKALHDM